MSHVNPSVPADGGGRSLPNDSGGSLFRQHKPQQGRTTRTSTRVAVGILLSWGSYFLYQQLQVFEGDEGWRLLVTAGIPMLFFVALGAVAWWCVFCNRSASEFMIATEGEMKKVSWSDRKEIIGSTKVVILFTFLLAALLFVVDLFFQWFFSGLGVLKT